MANTVRRDIKFLKSLLIGFATWLAFCGTAFADRTVTTVAELADAVANAASGETIYVQPGEYDISSYKANQYYHLYTGNRTLTIEGTDATSWRNNGNKTKAVIKGGSGGSEHVFGFAADVTLKNLTFTGAYKTPAGASLHRNGSGSATVTNCVFASNKSTYHGGAVNASGVFQDCLFDANSSATLGGAFYHDQTDGLLKCVGCSFANDKTTANQGQGGAIYQVAGTVEIVDCTFASCVGDGGYTAAGYRAGGAIYAAGGTTTVTNTTFTSCTAPYSGGAIVVGSKGNLEAVSCTFKSCAAWERGGAVAGGVYRDCVFDSNQSWRGGAAANIAGGYDCVFTNNYCSATGDDVGGALFHDIASNAVISGCMFVKNRVSAQQGLGGAIYQSVGTLLVTNTTFDSCTATGGWTANGYRSGGAICEAGGTITLFDSVFTNCTAVDQNGGAITVRSGSLTAHGCSFVGNRAVSSGAVHANGNTFLTNCTFTANVATSTGGAISACTNIVDCTFADNASAYFSGHCWNCTVRKSRFSGLGSVGNSRCIDCVFDGARTTDADMWNRGLVIAVNNGPSETKCVNCLFVNCDCFYMLQSWGLPLSIINCTFADNRANSYLAYGADYNDLGTGATFTFTNAIFNGSRSEGTGHGLQVDIQADSSGVVNVDHCVAETVELPQLAVKTELTVAKARFVGPDHRSGAPRYTPRYGDGNVVGKGALLDWTDADVDLAGNPRLRDGRVSLGCYEPSYERLGSVLLFR